MQNATPQVADTSIAPMVGTSIALTLAALSISATGCLELFATPTARPEGPLSDARLDTDGPPTSDAQPHADRSPSFDAPPDVGGALASDAEPSADGAPTSDAQPDAQPAPPTALELASRCAVDDRACGRYIEQFCRVTLGWADVPHGPPPAALAHVPGTADFQPLFEPPYSPVWPVQTASGPGGSRACEPTVPARRDAREEEGFAMCTTSTAGGGFAVVRFQGHFDNNDLMGIALTCDGGTALDATITARCSVHLARADNGCGPHVDLDGEWGTLRGVAPDVCRFDAGNYMLARTVGDGRFGVLPTPPWRNPGRPHYPASCDEDHPEHDPDVCYDDQAPLSRDDTLAVAWRCAADDMGEALQRSAEVVLGWAVVREDFGPADIDADLPPPGSNTWIPGSMCTPDGVDTRYRACVTSGGDGAYHLLGIPFESFPDNGSLRHVAWWPPEWPGDLRLDEPCNQCQYLRPHAMGMTLRARAAQ